MEIDKKSLEKVKEFFAASRNCDTVYIAGDKIFTRHGAAESYVGDATKVTPVKRSDVTTPNSK